MSGNQESRIILGSFGQNFLQQAGLRVDGLRPGGAVEVRMGFPHGFWPPVMTNNGIQWVCNGNIWDGYVMGI